MVCEKFGSTKVHNIVTKVTTAQVHVVDKQIHRTLNQRATAHFTHSLSNKLNIE